MSKRQWINAPVADIIDRTQGKFDYGIPGKVVENPPHIMKYWSDFASYPFQSHDSGSSPKTSAGASSSRRWTPRG